MASFNRGGNRDFIKNFFRKRKIDTLIHFTDSRNLDSILKKGLLSREKLDAKGCSYYYNDNKRLDGSMNYISLSITKPNHFLMDSFQKRGKIQNPVILEIDASMLWNEFAGFLFCTTNAAAACCEKGSDLSALKAMFADEVETAHAGISRRSVNTPANEPTDVQAEILWNGWVKKEYIERYTIY